MFLNFQLYFQPLGEGTILVLGSDLNLWLENGPFGRVPPSRVQIDGNVSAFQGSIYGPYNDPLTYVMVLGTDGKLWLEQAPFGTVPPARTQIDANVQAFNVPPGAQAIPIFGGSEPASWQPSLVLVLGTDGNLWLEEPPFDQVPPKRTQVDGNVLSFQGISMSPMPILVLGTNRNLWLEEPPFGQVPPKRTQVDGNVQDFQDTGVFNYIYVLGMDGKLWLENGPFGAVPPSRVQIAENVFAFQVLSLEIILVLGTDGNLWIIQVQVGSSQTSRTQIDGSVLQFYGLFRDIVHLTAEDVRVFVLGSDNRLWLELPPFGHVPPNRQLVDENVGLERIHVHPV